MRILFLAHRIPYPPDKGEKIRAYHELRFLSARHSIDLFCFADSAAEAEQKQNIEGLCRGVYVETRRFPTVAAGAARSFLRGEPLSCGCFFSRRFRTEIHRAIATESYDVIFVYCSSMAQYIPRPLPAPLVADFVDVDSAKWAQYARRTRFPLSWVFAREAGKLARYEEEWARSSYATIVTTPREAALLPGGNLLRVEIIGNGVEIPSSSAKELPAEIRALQPYVLFVGTMDYLPNVDAVEYFANDILPRVRQGHPELRFVVAGRDPARRVRKLAQRPGVIVTGAVPRVDAYLSGSTAVVAPFRIAQGIQNKVLEALAAGKPVVSTSGPAGAIGARRGETLLVADSPQEFADALISLLEDPALPHRFEKGPDFVRRNFDWQKNLDQLEQLLHEAAGLPPGAKQVVLNRAEAS
jgi:polysaccharide biosynthesis protein PslH